MGSSPEPSATESVGNREIIELFQRHNRVLIETLVSRLGDYQEAKDVAQEAYARLLELERPNTVSFLRAFLFKIANNLAIDRLRARTVARRVKSLEFFETIPHGDSVEREAVAAEQVSLFWTSLKELPDQYRSAVLMNRIQDLSYGEIAQKLGKTERTIRRYVVTALAYCQLRIQGASPDEAKIRSVVEPSTSRRT